MKISENTSVSMPIRNMLMIIGGVVAGVIAYTELTGRLTSLETSRELFEADLLKKSEQLPTDQEQYMLIEDLYKTTEKLEETQEQNMTNKVNIEFLRDQLDKALNDIEDLKDKVRANGKISENTSVSMPIRNMLMIIGGVVAGVIAYTELTGRLTSLETSRELFEADLLKKSEQLPTDQEQYMLIEDLYKTTEKLEETQEQNMTNKVNIEFLRDQLDKALNDIEDLKDKVRANGKSAH